MFAGTFNFIFEKQKNKTFFNFSLNTSFEEIGRTRNTKRMEKARRNCNRKRKERNKNEKEKLKEKGCNRPITFYETVHETKQM